MEQEMLRNGLTMMVVAYLSLLSPRVLLLEGEARRGVVCMRVKKFPGESSLGSSLAG